MPSLNNVVFWGMLAVIAIFFIAQIVQESPTSDVNASNTSSLNDLGSRVYPENNAVGWLIIVVAAYAILSYFHTFVLLKRQN